MIDPKTLSIISERLKLAKNSTEDFGGLKIILCGDPRQLPPVGAKRLWSKIGPNDSRIVANGLLLYRSFNTVCELTASQRQTENSFFAGLCDRIGEGQMTEEDYTILASLNE